MELTFKRQGNVLLVQINGELDLHTAERLRREIDDRLHKDDSILHLILDLKGIDFIDSSGLGVILGRYKLIKSRGGQLGAISVSSQVRRIFELSGMLQIIKIYDRIQDAARVLNVQGF